MLIISRGECRLNEVFQISQESHYNFTYVGLQVNQHQDAIKMHQSAYISEMEVMEIDKECLHASLNADEKQKYRTLIGQLNWVSSQTRPDIAFEACKASVSFKDANESDLTKANKVIRKLQSDEVILQFSDLGDLKDCKILSYNDSSYKNLPDGPSQGGFIALLWDPDGNLSPIHWQSRKIRHVVKIKLATECLALEEAAETCFWVLSLQSYFIVNIKKFQLSV